MTVKSLFAMVSIGALALGMAAMSPTMDPPKDKPAGEQPKAAEGAAVGTTAPDFTLTDTDGKTIKLSEVGKGKIVVIEWFNPECPIIVGHHEKGTFAKLQKDYMPKGIVFLAINSSGPGKEGNGKEKNAKARANWKMEYPVLIDEDGKIGKAYGAKCTPHMFIIGKDGKVAYNGAIDNGSAAKPGATNYVAKALDEMLAGGSVTETSNRPYGCGIKWASK